MLSDTPDGSARSAPFGSRKKSLRTRSDALVVSAPSSVLAPTNPFLVGISFQRTPVKQENNNCGSDGGTNMLKAHRSAFAVVRFLVLQVFIACFFAEKKGDDVLGLAAETTTLHPGST